MKVQYVNPYTMAQGSAFIRRSFAIFHVPALLHRPTQALHRLVRTPQRPGRRVTCARHLLRVKFSIDYMALSTVVVDLAILGQTPGRWRQVYGSKTSKETKVSWDVVTGCSGFRNTPAFFAAPVSAGFPYICSTVLPIQSVAS